MYRMVGSCFSDLAVASHCIVACGSSRNVESESRACDKGEINTSTKVTPSGYDESSRRERGWAPVECCSVFWAAK